MVVKVHCRSPHPSTPNAGAGREDRFLPACERQESEKMTDEDLAPPEKS